MSSNIPFPAKSGNEIDDSSPSIHAGVQFTSPNRSRAHRLLRWVGLTLLIGGAIAAHPVWQWHKARLEWKEVEEALERRDLARAAFCLDRFLKSHPDNRQARFMAARTARRLGRMSEAERYLEECQNLSGGVAADTRLEWDLIRVQQGDLRDIHLRLRATIGPDHPDSAIVLEALAKGYYACELLSDAREACELWRQREPDQPWPWLWRGRIFERLQYFDKAEEDYRQALSFDPNDRDVCISLGNLLAHKKQPGEAAELFDRVLQHAPADHDAMLGLASCRIEQGRADQAIPLIERVLSDEPTSPSAVFLRGKAAWQQGDSVGAERWLRQAAEMTPDDGDALYLLIQCLRDGRQEAEAGRLTKQLEQLRRELLRLDELIQIIAKKPDALAPRQEAGEISLRIGRSNEGLRWLNSALRLKGDQRRTHQALANYYYRINNVSLAETHRQLANHP